MMFKLIVRLWLLSIISPSLFARESDTNLENELNWMREEGTVAVVSKQSENKNTAAGIVSVVTREDIERYGGNNLFEILNRVTSLYMVSTSIFMKGVISARGEFSDSSNTHTLILINGRPFRDSGFGGILEAVLRDFPIHHIQQIEVSRGSGSVLYGSNAYTAVINIVTKKDQETALALRGRYGSYQTGQIESDFSWKNEQASLTGAIRYRDSKGSQFSAAHLSNGSPSNSSFRLNENDISASLNAQWQNLSFNGFAAHSPHLHWGPANSAKGEHQAQDRIFLDLGYKNSFNAHWTSQWNITYNQLSERQEVPAFLPPTFPSALTRLSENNLLFEQTQFLNFFDKRLNLLLGGLAEWQTGRINQAISGAILPEYNHLKSSIYGEGSYVILQNMPFAHSLKLSLGAQWHRMDHLEKSPTGLPDKPIEGTVGRLGIVYEATPAWGAKFLYSQAFRAASAFGLEIHAVPIRGDRNLQPERIETLDAQIFYHHGDYQASLTAFRSRISNLIVQTNTFPEQYVNSTGGVYQGLELETEAKLFTKLHWKGSYTFQSNRSKQGQNNLSPMPNHSAKIGLSYDVNQDLQASAFYTFFSQGKVLLPQAQINPKADAVNLLSLNLNYRLDNLLGFAHNSKHITFSFYIDNLLNDKTYYPSNNSDYTTLPGNPGRTLLGELAIQL